jgi:hypothetical protein
MPAPTLFRSRLIPGTPTGDLPAAWTPAWFADGRPTGEAALVDASGKRFPFVLTHPFRADTCTWHAEGYQCPEGTPPGTYATDFGGVPGPAVEVVAARPLPRRKGDYTAVSPWTSADTLAALFAAYAKGKVKQLKPIWLESGRHYWDRDLAFPAGAWVDGVSARVCCVPNGRYGERLVYGGQDCTFRGVEFEPFYLVQHADGAGVTGTQYLDCTFRGAGPQNLGWGMTGVHIEGCEFRGVGTAAAGLYLRNRFTGPQGGLNVGGPSAGGVCLIDNEFDGTHRGPVFNTNGGAITDALVAGCRVHGQLDGNNGGEAFLCEGAHPFDRFLLLHHRVWANESFGLSTWDAPIPTGGRVVDFRQEGGLGLWLAGAGAITQTGIVVDVWELADSWGVTIGWRDAAGKAWGDGVAGNTLRNGAVIGLRQSGMLNQGQYNPAWLARPAALWSQVAGGWSRNTVEPSVRCCDLPAGVADVGEATAAVN